jgi:hypothetical protein
MGIDFKGDKRNLSVIFLNDRFRLFGFVLILSIIDAIYSPDTPWSVGSFIAYTFGRGFAIVLIGLIIALLIAFIAFVFGRKLKKNQSILVLYLSFVISGTFSIYGSYLYQFQ